MAPIFELLFDVFDGLYYNCKHPRYAQLDNRKGSGQCCLKRD